MNKCFENINYLQIIVAYLDIKAIEYLSMSNRTLKYLLDPKNNSYVNTLFLLKIINEFFDFDKSYNKNKKILLGKIIKYKVNWKQYYNQLIINFSKCEDQMINKKIRDFFRIHIYLPDLRKDCFILEFQNSTIHQMKCYDTKINLMKTYNYYSRYFNPELVLNKNEDNGKIVILREKLIFEDYLINFKKLFYDFINNEKYKRFINNVYEYNFDILQELYLSEDQEETNFKVIEENNNLIKFIVWICNSFILYTNINCYYIKGLLENDNTDEQELITEFINKKNDLENCGLLINGAFENVNIIVNLLSAYKKIYDLYANKYLKSHDAFEFFTPEFHLDKIDSAQYKSIIIFSKKFTLYNFFLKIIDKYYTKNLLQIKEKFKVIAKDYFREVFNCQEKKELIKKESQMEIEEENKNEIKEEIKEEKIIKSIKSSKKILLENYLNCELDDYIDEKNANGIMHTQFKVDKSYIENCENVLIKIFEEEIIHCFKEGMPIEKIFEIVEKITRCEGNSKNLYSNKESLNLIRRTKMRLMEKGYLTIFNQLIKEMLKDFEAHIKIDNSDNQKYIYLSTMERLSMKEYMTKMDMLSKEGQENVKKNIINETDRAINYIKTNENLKESESYLASDYIKCQKIEYSFFFKKLIWNYYMQLEIYKERDYKIKQYIENNRNKFINKTEDYKNAVNDCGQSEPNENSKELILLQ